MSYKIIRVRNGIVSIASNDGTFFDVSIEELDFEPKVGDEVQCFRNGEKVIVFKDEAPPRKQKLAPSPIPQNEQPSNLQANAEISTVSKTDIQGVEQNTPVENLFSDDVVEKKSRVPWVIGIMLLLLSVLLGFIYLNNNNVGTMTDPRDGQIYRTVVIGNQTWMAENLNYKTKQKSWCNGNDESNCAKYGRLYTWKAAMNACPSGWHLPNKVEFETLRDKAGGYDVAGKKLKSKKGWSKARNGTDDFGFSALPAGAYYYSYGRGKSIFCFDRAQFWTATESESEYYRSSVAYACGFYDTGDYMVISDDGSGKKHGLSVRCLKD